MDIFLSERGRNLPLWSSKPAPRPETSHLDSSLKKCTAFVRRLKALSSDQMDAIRAAFKTLNLEMYASECVVSLFEAKIRPSDMPFAVEVASLLHQRYAGTAQMLFDRFKEYIQSLSTTTQTDLLRTRAVLRFFTDLAIAGVFPPHLANRQFPLIINHASSAENPSLPMPWVVGWLKYADAKIIRPESTTDRPVHFLSVEEENELRESIRRFFEKGCLRYCSLHLELHEAELTSRRYKTLKGTIPEDHQQLYERIRTEYDLLLSSLGVMGEFLGQELPKPPEPEAEDEGGGGVSRVTISAPNESVHRQDKAKDMELSIFDDEETERFYCDILNIREILPGSLLMSSSTTKVDEEPHSNASESKATPSFGGSGEDDAKKDAMRSGEVVSVGEKKGGDVASSNTSDKIQDILSRLPTILSCKRADDFSRDISMIASKGARRRLVAEMLRSPREQLELLPYFGRVIATIGSVFVEVKDALAAELKAQFEFQLQRRDQVEVERRVWNAKFVGELVKFNMFPPNEALDLVALCLDNFSHFNINVCAALLETCGRFLVRNPATHLRANNILDTLWRIRNLKNLSEEHLIMIDGAYYTARPPETSVLQAQVRQIDDPQFEYMRHLLLETLRQKGGVRHALRQILFFPFNTMREKLCLDIATILRNEFEDFSHFQSLGYFLREIGRIYPETQHTFIDLLCEDILAGMKEPRCFLSQKRLFDVMVLCELFNNNSYKLRVTFLDVLLVLLRCPFYDKAEEFFRLRLTCIMLESLSKCVVFSELRLRWKLPLVISALQLKALQMAPLPTDLALILEDVLVSINNRFDREYGLQLTIGLKDVHQAAGELTRSLDQIRQNVLSKIDQSFHFILPFPGIDRSQCWPVLTEERFSEEIRLDLARNRASSKSDGKIHGDRIGELGHYEEGDGFDEDVDGGFDIVGDDGDDDHSNSGDGSSDDDDDDDDSSNQDDSSGDEDDESEERSPNDLVFFSFSCFSSYLDFFPHFLFFSISSPFGACKRELKFPIPSKSKCVPHK
eukprot:TRINITY_DN1529_c1_g1_i6.p1 TRINITY_DN1529_c1_g1~~TRINITY_DN1529_c1_g1_i6.p1  ORF type:complete len:1046 (-),score=236.37 TRINITY_DN1529_c1_g1_i6:1311-4379(-)